MHIWEVIGANLKRIVEQSGKTQMDWALAARAAGYKVDNTKITALIKGYPRDTSMLRKLEGYVLANGGDPLDLLLVQEPNPLRKLPPHLREVVEKHIDALAAASMVEGMLADRANKMSPAEFRRWIEAMIEFSDKVSGD